MSEISVSLLGEIDGCVKMAPARGKRYVVVRSKTIVYRQASTASIESSTDLTETLIETLSDILTDDVTLTALQREKDDWTTDITFGFGGELACGEETTVNVPSWADEFGNGIAAVPSTAVEEEPAPIETLPATRGSRPDTPQNTATTEDPVPTQQPAQSGPKIQNIPNTQAPGSSPTLIPTQEQPSSEPTGIIVDSVPHEAPPDNPQDLAPTSEVPPSQDDTEDSSDNNIMIPSEPIVETILSSYTTLLTYTSDGRIYATLHTSIFSSTRTEAGRNRGISTSVTSSIPEASESTSNNGYQTKNDSSNKGIIIGGVVVGVLALLMLGFAAFYIFVIKKKQKQRLRDGVNELPPASFMNI